VTLFCALCVVVSFFQSCLFCNCPLGCRVSTQINKNGNELFFCLRRGFKTGSWAHKTLYLLGMRGISPGFSVVQLYADHSCPSMPRLRMCEHIPRLPFVLIAWHIYIKQFIITRILNIDMQINSLLLKYSCTAILVMAYAYILVIYICIYHIFLYLYVTYILNILYTFIILFLNNYVTLRSGSSKLKFHILVLWMESSPLRYVAIATFFGSLAVNVGLYIFTQLPGI
jgi:hypothetical protein